jgi:hypothetical protein
MCYFCHAQLFEITHVANIKSTLVQHSCRNAEVVEAFCPVAASRSNTRRSIHQPPVAARHAPAEMPTALSGSPVGRDPRRLVLASRLPSRAAPTCDPHSARCSAGCHTSRDFVPWRFLDAGQLSLRSVSSLPASKNQRISTLSDMAGPACVADSVGCKTAKRGRAGQKPSELYYTSRGIHYKLRSYWSCMAKCRIDLCLGNERGFASDWRTV